MDMKIVEFYREVERAPRDMNRAYKILKNDAYVVKHYNRRGHTAISWVRRILSGSMKLFFSIVVVYLGFTVLRNGSVDGKKMIEEMAEEHTSRVDGCRSEFIESNCTDPETPFMVDYCESLMKCMDTPFVAPRWMSFFLREIHSEFFGELTKKSSIVMGCFSAILFYKLL